jgi:hypothetical protein
MTASSNVDSGSPADVRIVAGAWERLRRSPGLLLFAVAVNLLPAMLAARLVRGSLVSVMDRFAVPDGGLLRIAMEVIGDHSEMLTLFRTALSTSVLLTLLLWTLVLAGVLRHLEEPRRASSVVAAGVRGWSRIVVVGLWNLLARLALVGVPIAITVKALHGIGSAIGAVVCVVVWLYCTCALDLARCRVVLRPQRPFHPLTTWRTFREAWRRPRVLGWSMGFGLLQWICALAIPYLALDNLQAGPILGWSRALAVLAVVFAVFRLAVAVEAVSGPSGRRFAG